MSKMVERFLTYCRESEVDLQVFDVPDDADLVGVVSGNFYFYFRDESVTVRFYREAGGRFKARDKIRDISYCPYDLNLNRDGRFNSHVFIRIEFRHTSYYAEVMGMYITVNLKCLKGITIDIFLNDSDAHPADNFGPIVKYKYQEDLSVSIQNAVCEYLRKAFFKDEREAWCKNFGLLHRDEIAWGFFGYGDFYEEVKKRS